MIIKKNAVILLIQLAVIVVGCSKSQVESSSDFLKFSNATVHVSNMKGTKGKVLLESNIAWELSVEAPAPDWMMLNKYAGINTDSIVVTATKDNNTGGYKLTTIVAKAVNNGAVLPVRLTVVQYDSTFKGKYSFQK